MAQQLSGSAVDLLTSSPVALLVICPKNIQVLPASFYTVSSPSFLLSLVELESACAHMKVHGSQQKMRSMGMFYFPLGGKFYRGGCVIFPTLLANEGNEGLL